MHAGRRADHDPDLDDPAGRLVVTGYPPEGDQLQIDRDDTGQLQIDRDDTGQLQIDRDDTGRLTLDVPSQGRGKEVWAQIIGRPGRRGCGSGPLLTDHARSPRSASAGSSR